MEDIINKIKDIDKAAISEDEKFARYSEAMAFLKPSDNAEALTLACTLGAASARRLNRPEMEAQFIITRAKVLIMKPVFYIKEMKEIKLAPAWFQFALESEKKRYIYLETELKSAWIDVQSDINRGFEAINKQPFAGPAAFCLKTTGEIYGQYYLQLRLHHYKPRSSFLAKLAGLYPLVWLRVDDYLVLNQNARTNLKQVRKDCLKKLHQAVKIFKRGKNYDYLADVVLALATEHRSFNNPVRERIYLIWAERLIKKFKLKNLEDNLALQKDRKS